MLQSSNFSISAANCLEWVKFGKLTILITSGLFLNGLVEGVQFQSPPKMTGKLLYVLRMLLRSLKKSTHTKLGPYTAQKINEKRS